MKLETLKKNNSKKILIGGLIGVCLVSVIGFTATRAKYKSIQSMKLANGTINYTSADLNLIAMYQANEDGTYDTITSVPSSGYALNTEKSVCNVDGTKDTSIEIEYINGKINIANLTKKGTKCYLYFDIKTAETVNTAFGTIVAKLTTPTFTNVATTDEGIFSVADGMYGGTSYYWRGAATTNHVIFANKCWRIIRINGDGSLRLIYNGAVLSGNKCFGNGKNADSIAKTNIPYNTSRNQSYYVGWTYGTGQRTLAGTESNIKKETESWYNSNITGINANKVADGKFCNDRDAQSGDTWSANESDFNYAVYKRTYTDYQPTLSCPSGDVYTLKVGAITADEVMYAGGKNENNTSYYLYNGQNYWTMSPSCWYSSRANVFIVNTSGYLNSTNVNWAGIDVRPVISLKANTMFATGGTGTTDKPYVVQ